MSAYDAAAPSFDRHRALPDGVAEAIRSAVLASIDAPSWPRLLDIGAGTGRIGLPFVAAGDDYVGVDLSLGMLREFARRAGANNLRVPFLAQADARRLPFGDATFDAALLIQVAGAAAIWQGLVAEVRRVLRSPGVLVIGRSVMPADGVDERMKQRLASILEQIGIPPYQKAHRDVPRWLKSAAESDTRVVAAEWAAERTPRAFLDRHRTGARFSALPEGVKAKALHELSTWAAVTFGSLDAALTERHAFELLVFGFHKRPSR